MKLITKTGEYVSPNPTQGTFRDVQIAEYSIVHRFPTNYLAISLEMFYYSGDKRIVLSTLELGFYGTNTTPDNSFRETVIAIPNKDYDLAVEGSKEKINVNLFDYLKEHNGEMPKVYDMIDWGYPNYTGVLKYFEGGTFENGEIKVSNPLTIGFILSQVMNGEPIGKQFEFVKQ